MFWNNNIMHQKTYNFKVTFGTGNKAINFDVKSVTLPKYDITLNEDLMGNTTHKSDGKGSWNDIEIVLYDTKEHLNNAENQAYQSNARIVFGSLVKTKGAARVVGSAFKEGAGSSLTEEVTVPRKTSGGKTVNVKEQRISQIIIEKIYGNKTINAHNASDNLNREQMVTRRQPTGQQYSEFWTIFKPVLKGVDFGEADYSSEELNTITMVFGYSHAKLTSTI